jgi:hypothetical protein
MKIWDASACADLRKRSSCEIALRAKGRPLFVAWPVIDRPYKGANTGRAAGNNPCHRDL